jgi:hypothetical protein
MLLTVEGIPSAEMAKRRRVFDRATALACLMPREFDGDQQDQQQGKTADYEPAGPAVRG